MSEFSSATEVLVGLFRDLHQSWFLGTTQDLTQEVIQWQPPPRAVPIAGHIAHAVLSEDLLLSGFVFGTPAVAQSSHQDTGISEMMPLAGPWDEWARRVTVDLTKFLPYVQAVFANTEERLSSTSVGDLERIVDLSSVGMATQPAGSLILTMAAHIAVHTGEISVIKGLQGQKGYAF